MRYKLTALSGCVITGKDPGIFLEDANVSHSLRSAVQLDSRLLRELTLVQRICLGFTIVLATGEICGWLIPAVRCAEPWYLIMNPWAAVALLCSTMSLFLCTRGLQGNKRLASRMITLLPGLLMVVFFVKSTMHRSLNAYRFVPLGGGAPIPGMTLQTAALLLLLCVVMVLLCMQNRVLSWTADACLSVLWFALLIAASEHVFNATKIYGVFTIYSTAPATLLGILLLTFAAFTIQAERGVFRILLGGGIGSNVARIAFPIILVMPFLLAVVRDRQLGLRLGPRAAAAIESSLAAMLALGLMLFFAWRIEKLEREISQLSLRDELTDLYNRRGFYLLARQAMHMAQRARAPLSVLFVDLDNLKQVNDGFGHDTGSRFLVEVAELLKESFRKTDVIGRIGGDEFVVAGESSEASMEKAVHRLAAAAAQRDADPSRGYPFCISLGFATMQSGTDETLEDLIDRADHNMYETKREKKQLVV